MLKLVKAVLFAFLYFFFGVSLIRKYLHNYQLYDSCPINNSLRGQKRSRFLNWKKILANIDVKTITPQREMFKINPNQIVREKVEKELRISNFPILGLFELLFGPQILLGMHFSLEISSPSSC